MSYRVKCPICKGNILVKVEDTTSVTFIAGDFTDGDDDSDRIITIYCEANKNHKIPKKTQDKLVETLYEFY
jgi:hypothetical protein